MRKILLTLAAAAPLFAQTVTGHFDQGATYNEPERNAPAAISRMFVRAADSQGVDLPASGQGGMIIVVNGSHASAARLRTPGGDRSSSSLQRFAVDAIGNEVLHVDRTIAGRYHLDGVSAGTEVIGSEPESTLTMMATVGPLSRMHDQPVTLEATLRDGDETIHGAHVTARLISPEGRTSDAFVLEEQSGGRYSTTFAELPSKADGFWTVRYDAEGTTVHGVEFARTSSNQFMNERSSAHLGLVRTRLTGDTLHVVANADVLQAGRYRLDVIVASARDANGQRQGIAWGESEQTLDAGFTRLAIDIPDITSEDVFVDVRLLNLDTMGVAGRVTVER